MALQKPKDKILVIVGPTASGKSDLAIRLAKKFHGEIISADSRQVYRGLDIGTGKVKRDPDKDPDKGHLCSTAKVPFVSGDIPHHLLDVASPKHQFTVAQYQQLGKKALKNILKRHKLPVIIGGTGLYIDVLVNNVLLPAVKPNPKLRSRLEKKTPRQLYIQLQKLDPNRAKTIDRDNKRRLVRALEIIEATGKPIPPAKTDSKYRVLSLSIKLSDTELKKRIKRRLTERLRQGMIKEVEKLRKNGIGWQRLDDLGLEYRWISRHLRGLITKQEMLEKLETEIWRYAKRQMTWFKRNKTIHWINKKDQASVLAKKFLHL